MVGGNGIRRLKCRFNPRSVTSNVIRGLFNELLITPEAAGSLSPSIGSRSPLLAERRKPCVGRGAREPWQEPAGETTDQKANRCAGLLTNPRPVSSSRLAGSRGSTPPLCLRSPAPHLLRPARRRPLEPHGDGINFPNKNQSAVEEGLRPADTPSDWGCAGPFTGNSSTGRAAGGQRHYLVSSTP